MGIRPPRSLHIYAALLSTALVIQYALGMYVNLYISFPQNASAGQLWEFAWSQKALASHIVLAILILIGGVVLLLRAVAYRSKKITIASGTGLLAVLVAGASGASFIPSQSNLYSYSMAIAFVIAILAYASILFTPDATSGRDLR